VLDLAIKEPRLLTEAEILQEAKPLSFPNPSRAARVGRRSGGPSRPTGSVRFP
jgi:hypothetical protein